MLSTAEENYLKAVFKLSVDNEESVNTNAIATEMKTAPASVTDMLKKLSDKDLVKYQRYKGVHLTEKGFRHALQLIRKHRLWETFLVDKLEFSWDEVHEVAEQLEHIYSEKLVDRLDKFLEYPTVDPHGDPIPQKNGTIPIRTQFPLSQIPVNEGCIIIGVSEDSSIFLQHLNKLNLSLGTRLKIVEQMPFDGSIQVRLDNGTEILLTAKVHQYIMVKKDDAA